MLGAPGLVFETWERKSIEKLTDPTHSWEEPPVVDAGPDNRLCRFLLSMEIESQVSKARPGAPAAQNPTTIPKYSKSHLEIRIESFFSCQHYAPESAEVSIWSPARGG
jgi:hypothetical protein